MCKFEKVLVFNETLRACKSRGYWFAASSDLDDVDVVAVVSSSPIHRNIPRVSSSPIHARHTESSNKSKHPISQLAVARITSSVLMFQIKPCQVGVETPTTSRALRGSSVCLRHIKQ